MNANTIIARGEVRNINAVWKKRELQACTVGK
jgi:hypothetical protein